MLRVNMFQAQTIGTSEGVKEPDSQDLSIKEGWPAESVVQCFVLFLIGG